jgi:hypothetical protein
MVEQDGQWREMTFLSDNLQCSQPKKVVPFFSFCVHE